MIPQELISGLSIVRRRIWLLLIVRLAGIGLLAGAAAGILLLVIARFVPVLYSVYWALALLAAGLLTGAVAGLLRPPAYKTAARAVDNYGLQDRMQTALHYAADDSTIARLQRAEAIELLLRLRKNAAKIVPFTIPKKSAGVLTGALLLFTVLGASPNSLDRIAVERHQVKQEAAKIAEEAKKIQAQMQKQANFNAENQAKLDANLKKLEQELKAAQTKEDLQRAVAKQQSRLQQLQKDIGTQLRDREQLAQELAKAQAGKELADALKSGNANKMNQAIAQLKQQLAQLSDEQKKQLADALARAGDKSSGAVKDNLRQMADSLKNGDTGPLQAELDKAADLLANLSPEQIAQLGNAGRMLAQAGAAGSQGVLAAASPAEAGDAGDPANDGPNHGDTQGQAGQNGQGSGNGQGQGNANGQGQGSGQGQGQGSGNGQGQGQGTGGQGNGGQGNGSGNGAGSGSGNGGSGAGTGGSGWGTGTGGRDLVMVPEGQFGTGQQGNDAAGPMHQGSSQMTSGSGQVTPGVARPYQEVYRQYSDYARESVERDNLPTSEQELVRDYFSEIAP